MQPTWSGLIIACAGCFLLGIYASLHVPQAQSDLSTFRNWALGRIHGTVQCPKNYICNEKP